MLKLREPYRDSQGVIQRLTGSQTETHRESQGHTQRLTVSQRGTHTEISQRLTIKLTKIATETQRETDSPLLNRFTIFGGKRCSDRQRLY